MPGKKKSESNPPRAQQKSRTGESKIRKKGFPVVGIGASAGGLEALRAFFSKIKTNSGMAYVVVVHMTPTQPSLMPELLQNVTTVPVTAAKDGQLIEPDHVYVITPNKEITLFKNKIQLMDVVDKGLSHPIDLFLKSLGQDQGCRSAAVILSGTGSDGSLGIREIKVNEGLVLVQSRESAGYDGMPRSAINTGLVDMVLSPEEMPQKLFEYFTHPQTQGDPKILPVTLDTQQQWLNKIFAILRTHVGHDFSIYKINTILRRIGRRMGLNHIDQHETYVKFLREKPDEVDALFRELLIGVTCFFRDSESFDVLKKEILPEILNQIEYGTTLRIWVPGCSTGEEVYSLAIVLRECLDTIPKQVNLQFFGTDIDKFAVDKAREGLFPISIAAEVSEERLRRFFSKEGEYFRIRKEIRDNVVFSVQDVLKDPPFSRLHLLCCRNLLIYLNNEAQKKLLPLFHYTLNPNGILMLGSSETIGGFGGLFSIMDKKWKIFRRKEVPNALRQIVDFPSGTIAREYFPTDIPVVPAPGRIDISQLTQKAILDQFAPTAILIDDKGQILHVQGRTGKYLETPSGPPTNNIVDLARVGLRIELSSALRMAKSSGKRETRRRISVQTNGHVQLIDLHICPQKSPKELAGHFLVVFEDVDSSPTTAGAVGSSPESSVSESSRIAELERELQITRESHQTTIEELESSNEELKSTNEEMQSANEELQSTNEELESSKEELQSLNEELQTVNNELQSKLEELSAAHDDMHNLLNSTEIATIFLDSNLCIRRFTHKAIPIVNLIQTDIGRPLKHIMSNLAYDDMITDCQYVLETLMTKEIEVQTNKGNWYSMRLIPYRTTDNRIDGVVLTFTSIDDQKKTQTVIREIRDLTRLIFDMNNEPMAVLDQNGNMVIANTALSSAINVDQNQILGMDVLGSTATLVQQNELKTKLELALKNTQNFTLENFLIKNDHYRVDARIINPEAGFPYRILLKFLKKT